MSEKETKNNAINNNEVPIGPNKIASKCCPLFHKYELSWLFEQTVCFCCGLRTGILIFSILCIIDGIIEIGLGLIFEFQAPHYSYRLVVGTINLLIGIVLIIGGFIGLYGSLKLRERLLNLFFYWFVMYIHYTVYIKYKSIT